MASCRVTWISYTPVKGLRLQQIDEVELSETGIPGDRRFHLINEKGHLTNSTRVGALQQVYATWNAESTRLALHFPDGSQVEDEVSTDGEALKTSFYGRPVEGELVDGPFSDALSEFTGTTLRLVQPKVAGVGTDRGRKGAFTLLSEASLETLAGAADVDAVDARRFRMNFGVEGVEAHAEDDWIGRELQLGEAVLVPRGHVGRCLITSRHPETGEIDLDTLKTLATYRRDLDTTEKLPFGIYGEVRTAGRVRVGDAVALAG